MNPEIERDVDHYLETRAIDREFATAWVIAKLSLSEAENERIIKLITKVGGDCWDLVVREIDEITSDKERGVHFLVLMDSVAHFIALRLRREFSGQLKKMVHRN